MEEIKKVTEQEYIEQLQRLQAEFENFRKRTEAEKRDHSNNSNASLILQLLDVLDNFDLAIKHSADPGIKLVYAQFYKILEKQGVKPVIATGKFNPKFHEAIIKEEGETYGMILQEIKKGYMINDKLLRAAKVKIAVLRENK
ncbi:MAG: nucleotide exchange factor GrpE [Candidatus Pacearchaeota archaeon]